MSAKNPSKALDIYSAKLEKSLKRLEYSYLKVKSLSVDVANMDDESLEVWESFTSRFSRTVDIFLTKYVRAMVLQDDPGFSGTVRDFADYAEKLGLLNSADQWMEFRGFRNLIFHDYQVEEIGKSFEDLRQLTPIVLGIMDVLKVDR